MRVIRSILFFTTVLLFLMISSFYLLKLFSTEADSKTLVSPIIESTQKEKEVLSFFSTGFENAVNEALKGSKASYSIVIKNLKTGETYSRDPEKTYQTASLYKLWAMAVAYQQIEEGKITKDQILSDSVENLNKRFDISSESAELTEGDISLTVEDAIEKAITISDNYAALLLTSKLRLSSLTAFLKEEGFTASSVGTPPKTTATDITLFYEKLYNGQLISSNASKEMLEVLKGQLLNDRIPKYLPKDIQIAHKTGELDGVKHDAGIVFTPKGDYLIVMLSDSNDSQAAAERLASISKNVYEYFIK